jgi:formylglycine-generating enzyme required for sulfatase activity/serine/threonine protein kinase
MIEEFRIVRVLGAGGFGIVYQCENTYLPETVAIKEFLPPELACRMPDGRVLPLSPDAEESFGWARDRFLQEAKTLWELARPDRHPNIVRVTRYCEANGTAYMFMEFEQGRPLSAILETQPKLTPKELDGLFYPLLDGLERVHAAGIVHRDIKPADILIRSDGTPVLIDFGAARHVVPGAERSIVSAYTPVYAALEQYLDIGEQGPWTDIYSFGATLYKAVTGRKPMNASERLCGGMQIPAVELCQGLYPQPILIGIDGALALKPEERPQTVAEWRRTMLEAADTPPGAESTVLMRTAGPNAPTRIVSPDVGQERSPPEPVIPRPREASKVARLGTGNWLGALFVFVLLISTGAALYFRNTLFPFLRPIPHEPVGQRLDATTEGKESLGSQSSDRSGSGSGAGEDSAQTRTETKDAVSDVTTSERSIEVEGVADERPETEQDRHGLGGTQRETEGRDQAARDRSEVEAPTQLDVELDKVSRDTQEGSAIPKPGVETTPVERDRIIPGNRFSDDLAVGGAGPIMVWLPEGEFQMGSPLHEPGRNPDERLHTARIPQPFAVSETEITLAQFRRFVEDTGYRTQVDRESTCLRPNESWQELVPDMLLNWESPGYQVTDRYPVACISWNDAKAYAAWLSAKSGHEYRLPTEMEWEYAARAGTLTSRYWGDDQKSGCKHANTAECADDQVHASPAGVYPPNPFGLRDVMGNLAEWTCSDYGKGYSGAEARCSESTERSPRVFRGGSWLDAPELVRSAARDGAPANLGLNTVGFRLVRLPARSVEAGADDVTDTR